MDHISKILKLFEKKEETEKEKKKRIEKRAFSKKNRSHRFCIWLVSSFLVTFAFFLTSGWWLPAASKNDFPVFNSNIEINEFYTLSLIRYDFCEAQETAEIELDINQKKYMTGEWMLSVRQNEKDLNFTCPIEDGQNLIIRITGVSSSNSILNLTLSFKDRTKQISSVSFDYKPKNVTQSTNLPEKSETQYRIDRCRLNISLFQRKIRKWDKKIESQKAVIADIQNQNIQLQDLLPQQTVEEQKVTKKQIQDNLAASTAASENIKNYQGKITKTNAKIAGEQQKIVTLTKQ